MSTNKSLDPDNAPYDLDGSSDTDESYTEGSGTEDEAEKPVIKKKVEMEKRFRKPIMFTEKEVTFAFSETGLSKNYMDVNTKILEYGLTQQLPDHIINVAVIYALRFQMMCPQNNFSAIQKAAACTFLASKSEDSVRRLDSISNTFYRMEAIDPKSVDARKIPEVIKLLETFVLTVEGFQVNMRHPHRYLEQYDRILNLNTKILTNAHFVTTAIIQMTPATLQHPTNHIGATALMVAAEWCDFKIKSPSPSLPWYQVIEANRGLEKSTMDIIYMEFKNNWLFYKKHRNRLYDCKKKTENNAYNHRSSNDAQSERSRSAEKRKDGGKGNWHSTNSAERRDNRYPMERHNSSWSMPRKSTSDRVNYSGAVRSHPNSLSPNRHSGEDRLSGSHTSHGRYSSSHSGEKTHFSPSKMRLNEHVPTPNSHPGHKRSYDGGTGDHHQASIKHRKM